MRHLTVAIDHRFVSVGGLVYTDLAFATDYWRRYLGSYRSVTVFARVTPLDAVPPHHIRADDDADITFVSAGSFRGPRQAIRGMGSLLWRAARTARAADVVIIRNGVVSSALWLCLELFRRPYGKEVQGEIGESVTLTFAQVGWPVRALSAAAHHLTRAQVRRAAAVAYVTPVLAEVYPPGKGTVAVHYSSIGLPERPDRSTRDAREFPASATLLSVGRLEREKGHDVLIEAVARLQNGPWSGIRVRLVGDGSMRAELAQLAEELGVAAAVQWSGLLPPGPEIERAIDDADLFVLPSRIEGTPRALLEAMSRGLPSVGTSAGGVPDLLPPERVAAAGDPVSLAQVIEETLRADPATMSREDQYRAFEIYGRDVMQSNWTTFHEAVAHG